MANAKKEKFMKVVKGFINCVATKVDVRDFLKGFKGCKELEKEFNEKNIQDLLNHGNLRNSFKIIMEEAIEGFKEEYQTIVNTKGHTNFQERLVLLFGQVEKIVKAHDVDLNVVKELEEFVAAASPMVKRVDTILASKENSLTTINFLIRMAIKGTLGGESKEEPKVEVKVVEASNAHKISVATETESEILEDIKIALGKNYNDEKTAEVIVNILTEAINENDNPTKVFKMLDDIKIALGENFDVEKTVKIIVNILTEAIIDKAKREAKVDEPKDFVDCTTVEYPPMVCAPTPAPTPKVSNKRLSFAEHLTKYGFC